jgi:Amt family ammonium transporter
MIFSIARHPLRSALLAAVLAGVAGRVSAQTDILSTPGATARAAVQTPSFDPTATNTIPVALPATPAALAQAATNTVPTAPAALTPTPAPTPPPEMSSAPALPRVPARSIVANYTIEAGLLGQLTSLVAVGGFIAYYCGLTRAKNCGHTCTVLLAGALFGVTGFWISGFAVQTGGLGDAHAALMAPFDATALDGLDHELGFMTGSHHWGLMGSAGFFLSTDVGTRNATASLFLAQAILLALTVVIALGGALERMRLLSLAICSFLVGALIVPLLANWVWGGGWLAEMGREFRLGHGFVDFGGAGVIHLAAGTLALVFTQELGPRYGRFGRNHAITAIPGHNIPFVILGSAAILLGLASINGAAASVSGGGETAGLCAVNTLLGAAGGLVTSFFYALNRRGRADPLLLCRGLIGGAVSVSAETVLVDPWAAFLTGIIAALLIQTAVGQLERRRIDDPVGVVAVHGVGGLWGLIALGLFANGSAGAGINGVSGAVRGLFLGGGLQLVAQLIGGVVCFGVIFVLGRLAVALIQKIVGIRVDVADETGGLDLPKLGVLGYQADGDVEREP